MHDDVVVEALEALNEAMGRLAVERPVFHNEADFQFALAWQLQLGHPNAVIRLETKPLNGKLLYLDLAFSLGGTRVAVELKYRTRALSTSVNEERFKLRDHGAPDLGRYDIVKDLSRVEQFVAAHVADVGCVIVLTNDPAYWTAGRGGAVDDSFRIHDGCTLAGELAWAPHAGRGTTATREQSLLVAGSYPVTWSEYSDLNTKTGRFRSLSIHVGGTDNR